MQKRYHNYKRPLISSEENLRLLGFVEPGRYTGFDEMENRSGLTFEITHNKTGLVEITPEGIPTAKMASIISPAGVVIKDDSPIPLAIETNSGNANIRMDIVVVEHTYTSIDGGSPATYSIVTGSLLSPEPPEVPNELTMVIVGLIVVPAGATDCSGCTYVPKTKPGNITGTLTPWMGSFSPTGAVIGTLPKGTAIADGTGYLSNGLPIPNMKRRFLVGHDSDFEDYENIGAVGPVSIGETKTYFGGSLGVSTYRLQGLGEKIQLGRSTLPPISQVCYSPETPVYVEDTESVIIPAAKRVRVQPSTTPGHLWVPTSVVQSDDGTGVAQFYWGKPTQLQNPYPFSPPTTNPSSFIPSYESLTQDYLDSNTGFGVEALENRPPYIATVFLVYL